ncbi:MAG: ROK family protein, partial [Flavisolibacter sp.]|nr:ROK family protein [Flavisolibacter sp.]
MLALGIDLGGTKLSLAVFTQKGAILLNKTVALEKRAGIEVGNLIAEEALKMIKTNKEIERIGIAVPGIFRHKTGTVWAPNIRGWDDFPLRQGMQEATAVRVTIDSDRAAYILGESWMGNAKECRNAIYLAVGTGIGAGILLDGKILRGEHDIAGAIGWMALQQPFEEKYSACGCFEYYASGEGIPRVAAEVLQDEKDYKGLLKQKPAGELSAYDVFDAYEQDDVVAKRVFAICIH